jgi:hypothetical protein
MDLMAQMTWDLINNLHKYFLKRLLLPQMKEGAPLRAKAVPSKVRAYGPGLEPTGVVAKAPANFTVETFGAGDGDLTIRCGQSQEWLTP